MAQITGIHVGDAGTTYDVDTNTGAATDETQRVILASNDPAVALLTTIEAQQPPGIPAAVTGTLDAFPETVSIDATGMGTAVFLGSGTFEGLAVAAEIGDGTLWVGATFECAIPDGPEPQKVVLGGSSAQIADNTDFRIVVPLSGCTHARIVVDDITAGSVDITALASLPVVPALPLVGLGADTSVAVYIAASDATLQVEFEGGVALKTCAANGDFGFSTHKTIADASTNATVIENAPGRIYGWFVSNDNAAVRYFKLYDLTVAPDVGTDVPKLAIPIQPNSQAVYTTDVGIHFGAGMAFALTTGVADADTGAVSADEHVVNVLYASV